MPTGAIIYVRVSTAEQAKHGVSLEAQLDLARKYAQFRDLQVLEVISDEGVSGSLPLAERPGGAALLAQVVKDKVGAVIAYKLDRLFRDAADCLEITRQWDQINVDLHLVDIGGQPVDTHHNNRSRQSQKPPSQRDQGAIRPRNDLSYHRDKLVGVTTEPKSPRPQDKRAIRPCNDLF